MGMIERIAFAIFDQEEIDCGRGKTSQRDWDKYNDTYSYFNQARAAIQAMREPTEAMIIAWTNAEPQEGVDPAVTDWRAMIDAALDGEK